MSRNNGFTLVEILIALAILAMIVVSTFTIFRSSAKSWQKGETRSERYNSARVALGKMGTEVSQAVIGQNTLSKFIGKKDEISFVSFVSTSAQVFELAEIEYWLDNDQGYLMRNEDMDPDFDFSTQDHSDILADNIPELGFSYYDGIRWLDSWDSGDGSLESGLPKAVRIKIKVQDKKSGESESFEITTRLKMS